MRSKHTVSHGERSSDMNTARNTIETVLFTCHSRRKGQLLRAPTMARSPDRPSRKTSSRTLTKEFRSSWSGLERHVYTTKPLLVDAMNSSSSIFTGMPGADSQFWRTSKSVVALSFVDWHQVWYHCNLVAMWTFLSFPLLIGFDSFPEWSKDCVCWYYRFTTGAHLYHAHVCEFDSDVST